MSSVSGTKIHKGIVLSPNSRVTGRAQIIAVKGDMLLTPKSERNDEHQVQRCWETPSQPSGGRGGRGAGRGEKSKVKVGKKKETVGTFLFQIKTARGPWTCEKFLIDG